MSHIEVDLGDGERIGCSSSRPERGAARGGSAHPRDLGVGPDIVDAADRLAAEGYTVFAPDPLSSVGISATVGVELQAIMFSQDESVRTEGQPPLREALPP